MQNLLYQRCFSHSNREAAARCPECGRFFCRECVTEHEGRVICATCLRKIVQPRLTQRPAFVVALRSVLGLAGLLTAWLFFYLLGQILLTMPSSFHEGTLWKSSLLGEQAERPARPR